MDEKQVQQYLLRKGYTHTQVIGIMANLKEESGYKPNLYGDSGKAYGIAQWHPDRRALFQKKFGKSMIGSSVQEQLDFLDYELKNHEKDAYRKLKKATSVADSVQAFAHYERFSGYDNPSSKSFVNRLGHAKTLNGGGNIGNPSQYGKVRTTSRTPDANTAWTNYRNEMAAAQKLPGSKSVDKQEEINKKYAKEGWFGTNRDGRPAGAFNVIIEENNKTNELNTRNDAEAAFLVANNLDHFMGMQREKDKGIEHGKFNPSIKYKEKNGKHFIENDSFLTLDLKKMNPTDKSALERVLGRTLSGENVKIPTVELLKKVESQVNRFVAPENKIDLINHKTNARGKDLAFENIENYKNSNVMAPNKIYIPDLSQGDKGVGAFGFKATHTYEKRKFAYDPNQNYGYKKIDYMSTNPNWGVPETAIQDNPVSTPEDIGSTNYQKPDNSSNVQNIKQTVTEMSTPEKDKAYEEYKKKNAENFRALSEEQIRKNFDEYLASQPKNTSIGDVMNSFADAERPDQSFYDPKMFKEDIPYAELATSAMGIINGQKMAETDLPVRDEAVSSAFMNYASELSRLSEIGLRPEDEAYAKRMLSESYSSSVEQLKAASNGNRNIVLGNIGRLDYQKQEGLMKIALADANAKNEAFYKYGEAMKYISEFDANRDIANNEREYQNAMLTKQSGGALMASGWKSLMDNMQYYKENKPGSANHAYKSYMMQKMFEVDPSIKDDGSGTVPGTLSYKKKKDAASLSAWTENKELGQKYQNLSIDKQQEFAKVATQYGWNNAKGMLDYMVNNPNSGTLDFSKIEEASSKGDWKYAFGGQQSSTDIKPDTKQESVLEKINPIFQTEKPKPVEQRLGFLNAENQRNALENPLIIPEFDKMYPRDPNKFGILDGSDIDQDNLFGTRKNNKNYRD